MKGTARQQHGSASRKAGAGTNQVQAKRLPGAGNRQRADAHERQAEELAKRFVRGEKSLSARVSPVAPAAYRVAGSMGRPLPGALRETFEASFVADLREVRVHTGNAADAVAIDEGAEAFTSGRDIFFRLGRYAPETESGRELIAHELTHVLQQTGRRNTRGELSATHAAGAGGIQRVPTLQEHFKERGLFETKPTLDTVLARHTAENSSDPDLLLHVEAVKTTLTSTPTGTMTPAEELLELTKAPGFTKKPEHRAVYADALKQRGDFEFARQATKYTLPPRTAFGLNEFYTKKLKGDLKWMDGTISGSPLLSRYWKKRFVDTFRIHLFGLGRVEQDLGPDHDFNTLYEEQLKAAAEPAALIDNERHFYALAALKWVDAYRVEILRINRREAQKASRVHRIKSRRVLADILTDGTTLEDLGTKMPDEAKYLWDSAIQDIRNVADAAMEFWDRVEALEKAREDNTKFESYSSVVALIGDVTKLKEMKNLQRDFLQVAKKIFYLPYGKLPSAATYQAMMKAEGDRLVRLTTNYDLKLFELAREEARGKIVDQARYLELGWVQWLMLDIAHHLYLYEALPVPPTATTAEKRAVEDARVRHRLSLARWWNGVAHQLQMNELKNYLAEVALGTLSSQKQSMLALWGDWAVDKTSSLRLMEREFPKGEIEGAKPLTGADIANFSYSLYSSDLAAHIETILDKEGMATDFSGTKGPVINQALDRLKTRAIPQRYLLKEYLASVRPVDRDAFADLVQAHPKYTEFVNATAVGVTIFVPRQYSIHQSAGGLVIWTVPRIDELLALFAKKLPALDALVRAQMATNVAEYEAKLAAAKKGKEPPPLGVEMVQWVRAFNQVVAADPTQNADLHKIIVGGYEDARKALAAQARRASTHQRHVLVRGELGRLWDEYRQNKIGTYSNASEAVQKMYRFAAFSSPPKDAPLQMAALLIELGPLLYKRLGPQEVLLGALETEGTSRYDLIVGLLPHLAGTLALTANAATLAELKTLDLDVPDGFDKHLKAVEKLKNQTEQAAIDLQMSRELNVNKNAQSVSTPEWSYVFHTGVDNEFIAEQHTYQLLEVYETFTYVPEVLLSGGGIDWPSSELGDSLLTYGDGTAVRKDQRTGKTKLLKILRDGEEKVIYDNDERLLSELMYAVMSEGFQQSMARLGRALNTFGEILATGMEFIPGIGPAVMVVRVFTSIMMFVNGPQFKLVKEAFGGDAGKVAEEAIAQLESLFTADKLWGWLLFGEPALPTLAVAGETEKQKRVRDKHGKGSAAQRIGRLLLKLARLGLNLGERIGLMKDNFEYPLRRTKVFVVSHPLIGAIVELIIENFSRLYALARTDLAIDPDIAEKTIGEEMGKLSGQITGLLETIQELELPQEIIPLSELVDIVIEMAVDALPKKYELIATGVKSGLEMAGLWDDILEAVTDKLEGGAIDPNVLWQNLIRDKLEPAFESLCGEFVAAAGETLRKVPFLKGVGDPATPSVTVQPEEGEFPDEVQPSPSEHPLSDRTPLPAWPRGNGAPLDAGVHQDAARRFGHDFSHVRLHTGPDARAVTQSLGAEGLTSGSHVYLRPGLSPRSGHGADVFRHELSHVIQQTGPRPQGVGHSPAPVNADRGSAVRHDASLEAAADRSAAQAGRDAATRPIDPGSTSARAPQPKLDDVMKKFFTVVGSDEPLLQRVADINLGNAGTTGVRLNAYANRVADELPTKFKEALGALPKNAYPGYLQPAHEEIVKYVLDNHLPPLKNAMATIVKRAHEGKKVKTKSGGKTIQKIEYSLNSSRLKLELEEYLLGQSGIVIDIDFNPDKPAPGGIDLKQIDTADPISSLKVEALHLAYVGGTADLWTTIVKNTWADNTPLVRPPTRFKSRKDFANRDEAIATYKLHSRMVMRDAGPKPSVFMKTQFRFSHWFAQQVEDSIFTVAGGELDPQAVGPWDDYRSRNQTAKNFSSGSGHIHLAFGTYAERKKPGLQWGVARNAHHITQYLILEYLRNRKSDVPFRHALKHYPGVSGAGKLVKEIENPDDKTTIKVGAYETGRGGAMPTILISEHTHEQGGVHVHGKPDDAADESGASSPGAATHREFTDALGAYAPIMFDASPAKLQTVAKQTKGDPVAKRDEVKIGGKLVTSPELQKAIYRAANKTYHWMRDDMKGKLRRALRVEEVHFYETMIRRQMQENGVPNWDKVKLPKDLTPDAAHMNTVADDAEAHNKSIMEDATKVGFRSKI